MDRATLRQQLRANRKALTEADQQTAATQLAELVISQPFFEQSKKVALYLASDGEINPEIVASKVWQQGKQCFLPVLDQKDSKRMYFQRYTSDTVMTENRFGIPEPEFSADEQVSAEQLDLVLMPLTGFDEQGNRLGMGGGFYDRTFAFIKAGEKPLLIGLAHECQKVDQIPVEDWDVPMYGVITGQAFYQS
ncbi:5-formyltetrahydrofolate cyclo-ligase [Endozoicomonas sp. OPT23]|uniref:5-formyltetrahydrofolate cyclo-ligase n=1 Tax=Endozoicomonas sp. OPT23 TaxID=2072845 RepID=UPI001890F6A6